MLDYSKYKYEQAQKVKQARKHQQQITIREIKFRPKIAQHDYDTKKRHVERFLRHKDKVKVTIMFRGREVTHPERGMAILDRLAEELAELGVVEQRPMQEGRNMTMLLGPLEGGPCRARGRLRRDDERSRGPRRRATGRDAERPRGREQWRRHRSRSSLRAATAVVRRGRPAAAEPADGDGDVVSCAGRPAAAEPAGGDERHVVSAQGAPRGPSRPAATATCASAPAEPADGAGETSAEVRPAGRAGRRRVAGVVAMRRTPSRPSRPMAPSTSGRERERLGLEAQARRRSADGRDDGA